MRHKDDEKEQRIKDAVMQLILEEGFTGASMSKIAKRAGIASSTLYIYYENKEEMLRDIYREYYRDSYEYMAQRVDESKPADELIEAMIRAYYGYIKKHADIYSFIEQFSNCPRLMASCQSDLTSCEIFKFIEKKGETGEIVNKSDDSISSFLFYPVKAVVMLERNFPEKAPEMLADVIELAKKALLAQG